MDTICIVQFLSYESMMSVLCFKPSYFCVNKPSLYSRNIVGILTKLIFLGRVVLAMPHYHTWWPVFDCHVCKSLFIRAITASYSSIACWCCPWISSILASNPRGTMSFKMCSLSALSLSFWEFTLTYLTQRLRGIYPSCFACLWVQTNLVYHTGLVWALA